MTSPAATSSEATEMMNQFWPSINHEIKEASMDFKQQDLPLARIKRIMKLDDEVKMISAEAPVLFSKAAEVFIRELTMRSWIHTEDNKRRTLQRNDVAMAVSKFDQFDFLIDIVPREEIKPVKSPATQRTAVLPDQVQYFFTALQNQNNSNSAQPQMQQQTQQVLQELGQTLGGDADGSSGQSAQPQVFQQIVTQSGEVQNVPIKLTQAQLQAIQMQMQGKQAGQPILIQTANQSNEQSIFQIPQQVLVTGGDEDSQGD